MNVIGCVSDDRKIYNHDMTYMNCLRCDCLYIKELIDRNFLYADNHNVDVVGSIWNEHYDKFSSFISDSIPDNSLVLEIGDPSAKTSSKCHEKGYIKNWRIVEPNPSPTVVLHDRTEVVNCWSEEYNFNDYDQDALVLSHVFEHLWNPVDFLINASKSSKKGSKLFLSIPNLTYALDSNFLSPAGLCFEHTFYYDDESLIKMVENSGWKVSLVSKFYNQSFFVEAVNEKECHDDFDKKFLINGSKVLSVVNETKVLIDRINKTIEKTDLPVYLFGGCERTQSLIAFGMKTDKIICVLDNGPAKIGTNLYGTKFTVFDPSIIKGVGECYVICHMGVYTDEIISGLKDINPSIRFI